MQQRAEEEWKARREEEMRSSYYRELKLFIIIF